jgi:hypothetical protein
MIITINALHIMNIMNIMNNMTHGGNIDCATTKVLFSRSSSARVFKF